jgi:hypothetical protein
MRTVSRPAILLAMVIGVMASVSSSSAQGTATNPLPRVFVFTQVAKPGEIVAPDQDARQKSAQDVREALHKKTRILEVVDASGKANLTIEILPREAPSPTRCVLSVRARVVGRTETRQFQGESRTWKDAAALVADVIVRFVNETY